MKKLIGLLGMLLFLLLSCMKDDSLKKQLSLDSQSNGMAVLAVFNMVESSQLNVFLNNNMLNRVGEMLRYGEVLAHRIVFSGKRTVVAEVHYGDRVQQSVTKEINLEQGKNYSLFLYGNDANGDLLVEDNLILPQKGKFKVRFANFNRAQHASNIGDKGDATRYFNAVKANSVTNFIELDIKEGDFMVSGSGQKADGFPIRPFNPRDQGVYTILVTAQSLDLDSSVRPNHQFRVIRHSLD